MYLDRQAIVEAWNGLVGYFNPTNPVYPTLDPSLLESRSNLFVNEVHSLIDVENIDQAIKNFSEYTYAVFNVGTEYSKFDKVQEAGVNYEYINDTPSTGNTPPNATFWIVIDNFSDYLNKQSRRASKDVLNRWERDKKDRSKTKSIFDQVLLFSDKADPDIPIPNQDRFVGFQFRIRQNERNLAFIIKQIRTQFDASFVGLPIKVYNSSQQAPIFTYSVDQVTPLNSELLNLTTDNIFRYWDDRWDYGSVFSVGYKQSDLEALGAQAINRNIRTTDPSWGWGVDFWGRRMQWSRFVDVRPFFVKESDMPGDLLFLPSKVNFGVIDTYGLNFNLTTEPDLTQFFIQQERVFAYPVQLRTGMIILEAIANSERKGNALSNSIREEARNQIHRVQGVEGTVFDEYEKAIKGLEFDTSNMGDSAMPTDDPTVVDIVEVSGSGGSSFQRGFRGGW